MSDQQKRARAGRPRKAKEDKRVNVSLCFDPIILEKMKRQAFSEGFVTRTNKPKLAEFIESLYELNC